MVMMISPLQHAVRKQMLEHRLSILRYFYRVPYSCPKCKYKFEAPIEAVLELEEDDEWNRLSISTPPYTICLKFSYNECIPIYKKEK